MPELMQIMVDYFLENAENAGDGLRLLPGVISLLKYLKVRRIKEGVCLDGFERNVGILRRVW